MIKLEDKSNVNAPSGVYPYGSLRNNPGDNTGTPVNAVLVEDVMQLMEKIMAESGIAPNGLPDNVTNGWQLFEAMTVLFSGGIRRKIVDIGDWNMDTDAQKGVAHGLADYKKIRNITAMIRDDADTSYYMLSGSLPYSVNFGGSSPTLIALGRDNGGIFDSSDFDSTSYNRGYVIIEYVV